jgi:hypothetical protein
MRKFSRDIRKMGDIIRFFSNDIPSEEHDREELRKYTGLVCRF